MYKRAIVALLLALCGVAAFGQAKPRLGILPFAGGAGGDGETVATLFSFQPDILGAFTVVPRTSTVNALVAEQEFQMGGYTDSDTIARLGRMLNADFVVSGFIRRLGDRNLVITTIVNVETFEQLAGDYREYRTVEDVPALLPDISRVIINASRRDTSKLPKLAVVPFNIANTGVNVQDAEVLAQILSIEVGNAGKYVILPRTTAIQAAMKELEYQMSGATAEEEAKSLGRAINAEYVLSAEVRSLGSSNMFTASILNVEDGSLLAGSYRNYSVLADGIRLMPELAGLLVSGGAEAVPAGLPVEVPGIQPVRPPREARTADPDAARAARLNTLGVSLGSSFADPLLIASIHGTFSPVRNLFFVLGFDLGMLSGIDRTETYYSLYPFARIGYFLPFTKKGGWHIGAGVGYMTGKYTFSGGEVPVSVNVFAVDFATGFNLWNMIDISYALRTNFKSASNKVTVGYTYRFK